MMCGQNKLTVAESPSPDEVIPYIVCLECDSAFAMDEYLACYKEAAEKARDLFRSEEMSN